MAASRRLFQVGKSSRLIKADQMDNTEKTLMTIVDPVLILNKNPFRSKFGFLEYLVGYCTHIYPYRDDMIKLVFLLVDSELK